MKIKSILLKLQKMSRKKISLMYIPSAEQKMHKVYIPQLLFYGVLCVSLIAVIFLTSGFLYNSAHNISLKLENHRLELALAESKDQALRLQDLCNEQEKSIALIKDKAQEVAYVYEQRLSDVQMLKEQANSLIQEINQKENLNIAIPTSRSFDRNNITVQNNNEIIQEVSEDSLCIIDETDQEALNTLISLLEEDENEVIVKEDTEEYAKLIKDVEDKFEFLECRPDLRPAKGICTSPFGMRIHPTTHQYRMHKGIDIANNTGTKVVAAGSGVVVYAKKMTSFGNLVIINHGYGYKSYYAHNNKIVVKEGQHVKKGQKISEMGSTGRSTGPHLHFEIHYNGQPINPANVLK